MEVRNLQCTFVTFALLISSSFMMILEKGNYYVFLLVSVVCFEYFLKNGF